MDHFDFAVTEAVRKAVEDMGYATPTPIQEQAIPPMLEGHDVVGQAQTGMGKTAAFGIPLVNGLTEESKTVRAIVLCPTRELAVQTAGELNKLGKYLHGVTALPVYGGQPIERQLRGLAQGARIIVGTPGRVMDHMRRGSLTLANVQVAVLDEADEMLDMGFRDDIEEILSQTPATRQTALFSATMPFSIRALASKYLREPVYLRTESKEMTVEAVRQTYIPVRPFHKMELLARLILRDDIRRALVFVNTKLGAEEVVTGLHARGFAGAASLHGDMRQIERDAIMERFRRGAKGVLVATDVAARGLDIDDIEVVINYDMPLDVENYVHRIGRTGRAGREGRAYTFVMGRETSRMWEYRKITKAKILCEVPPSGEEVKHAITQRRLDEVKRRLGDEPVADALEAAKTLLTEVDAETAVAALIQMIADTSGTPIQSELDIRIPDPPPLPARPNRMASAPAGRFATAGRSVPGRRAPMAANYNASAPYPPRDRRPGKYPYPPRKPAVGRYPQHRTHAADGRNANRTHPEE